MNFALYSSDAPQTLLSLGQLHSCGGNYHSTKNPNILTITADNTTTLDITPLNDNSNLYNANISKILSILHANPHLLFSPTNPPTTSQFTPSLRKFIQQNPPSTHSIPSIKLHAYLNNLPTNTTSPDDNLATKVEQPIHRKISSEQYRRVLAANDLHYINAHKPDAILCQELSTGKHPYSDLTSTDVLLMRKILGQCPHCPNEKPTAIRLPSQTLPAQNPGDTISFDPSKLPCPVLGGATHSITMVDEKSGHISLPGIPSKSNAAVTKGIQKIIHVNYNAHGHQVKSLHGDAERINTSLAPFLGSIGTTLKVSYPNHHAHRAERTTQTIDRKARAIFSHLPYILPPETTLLLKQSVAETLNNSICKASAPYTRNEALSGFKLRRAPIGFGRCALVSQPIDKRVTISRKSGTPLTLIPTVELGVSMGLIPGSDKTQWLLSNGIVVPRIPIGPLLPPNFIPFNWRVKSPQNSIVPTFQQIPQILSEPDSNALSDNSEIQNLPPNASNILIPQPDLRDIGSISVFPQNLSQPISVSSQPLSQDIVQLHTTPELNSSDSQLPVHDEPPPAQQQQQQQQQSPDPQPQLQPTLPQPTSSYHTRSRTLKPPESTKSRGGYGGWGFLTALAPSNHKFRKLQNHRIAATRDRTHLLLNPPPESLTNRYTDIRPIPPIRQQNEWPLHKALTILNPEKVDAAVDKENKKCFETYKSLKVINASDVENNAVYVPIKLIIREKTNKDITARIALGGDRQPPHTYGDTHAGTSDATHRAFALAAGQAHAAIHNLQLITFNFDIPAAFLNNNPLPRTKTGNTQLFTRTPANLPAPYNNKICEVIGAHYGLKQSNNIYDQDFINLLTTDGFTQCPSHPYTFQKWSIPNNHAPPSHHLFVSMHVDDGDSNTTCPLMYQSFQKLIIDRYGPLPFHSPSQGTCGQTQVVNSDKSISLHYQPYILKMLTRIGMDNVPPALSPDIKGLFEPSTNTTPLSLAAQSEFRTINGELIHILPQRHDVRKVVTHLLTMNDNPDIGCSLKQLHLLRYLKSCPELGPTFSADPANYPNGVEIHSASDCAHNVHIGGQSHGAYQLTIGKPGATTSPFTSYSAKEKGVSLHPHEGEYVILSRTAKQLIHWRQFAEDLGFPQTKPSIMLTDNSTSINLTKSPLIPAKSRHIALKHHHIRWAFKTQQILPQHQGTNDIIPDAATTKHVGPSRFLYYRKQLFQTRKPPTPP